MNLKCKNIKFKYETENLNNFSFVDVKNYLQKQTVCYFDFLQRHV